jgi:methionine-rich copper-binding protein CopC
MLMIADQSMSHTLQSALSPADNNTNKHIPERFRGMLDWKLQFSFAVKIL